MTGVGNDAQVRLIIEQVVDAMSVRLKNMTPEPVQPAAAASDLEVPAPLKWAAAIVAALFTAATVGMALWVVTTLTGLQETVTRIDERQKLADPQSVQRFEELRRRADENARRIGVLEEARK